MKSWKVEAAIIAVGLLLLGIMVKGGKIGRAHV